MDYKFVDYRNEVPYRGIFPDSVFLSSGQLRGSRCLGFSNQIVKQSGVSLVELLVSMLVLAVLITLSAPDMRTLIVNNRVDNAASELFSSLMLARSEAVKRQRTVSLCSTVDQSSCDETRSGWHHGWLIFTDAAGDGLLNASDQLIRRVTVPSDIVSIFWNNGDGLQFNSRGQSARAGTFQICADEEGGDAKAIIVSMAGRVRTEAGDVCS